MYLDESFVSLTSSLDTERFLVSLGWSTVSATAQHTSLLLFGVSSKDILFN